MQQKGLSSPTPDMRLELKSLYLGANAAFLAADEYNAKEMYDEFSPKMPFDEDLVKFREKVKAFVQKAPTNDATLGRGRSISADISAASK